MRAAVFPTRSPRVVMQKQFYMFPELRLRLWMYFGFGRPCWGGYWRRGVVFLCFCAPFWAMLHPRWWARHLHLGLCHLPTVVGLSVVALRWAPARTTTRCVSRRLLIGGVGAPTVAPGCMFVGAPLNKAQQKIVKHLEAVITDVAGSGDIGPAEMGRTAAKVEGLYS